MSKIEKLLIDFYLIYILICIVNEDINMKWYDNLNEECQAGITALILILIILLTIFIPVILTSNHTPIELWQILCNRF